MTSRRTAKVSRAIQETVSTTVLFGLRDPRIQNVTVTRVEAADDVRSARVYVSIRGDAKMQALSLKGLNAARGYLQSKVADRLQTKNTPILRFIVDQSIKQAAALSAAMRAEAALNAAQGEASDADAGDPDGAATETGVAAEGAMASSAEGDDEGPDAAEAGADDADDDDEAADQGTDR